MRRCPKCNSIMEVYDPQPTIGSAVIDSPQITASGIDSNKKYNWICDMCGHTEIGSDESSFHS